MQAADLHKLVTMPVPFGKHRRALLADLPDN